VLIFVGAKAIDSDVFRALNSNSVVFDGKLIVRPTPPTRRLCRRMVCPRRSGRRLAFLSHVPPVPPVARRRSTSSAAAAVAMRP
jgi:hypothetical protein